MCTPSAPTVMSIVLFLSDINSLLSYYVPGNVLGSVDTV